MNPLPILVVDKKGVIGEALCHELISRALVVYVSQKRQNLEKVVFIPYSRGVPEIPNYIYSHTFVIDDDFIVEEYLAEFTKKAKKDNSMLVFVTSLVKAASFYNKSKGSHEGIKTIVLGDIIGKNTYPMLLYSAIKLGRIKLANDGLSKIYPVFISDVIRGIIEVAFVKPGLPFGQNNLSSIFYLYPKYPPTELSFARMIQKANPEVLVDFISQHENPDEIEFLPNGKHLLPDNYPLGKKIRELNLERLINSHINNNFFNISKNPKQKRLHFLGKPLLFLVLLLILPLVLTIVFSLSGFTMLDNSKTAIEKGSIANAQKSASFARIFFSLAKKSSIPLRIQGALVGQKDNINKVTNNINLGFNLSQMAIHAANGLETLSEAITGRSIDLKNDLTIGAKDLKNAITIYRQIEADGQLPSDVQVKIKSIDNLIKITENTIEYIPSLLGTNGKKFYLVLFQNNMELRPGGGFIGSYGVLSLDAGKITDLSIADVYDADGQLKGHVEPPYPIRRYLKLPHWYLRDSNFDVDFAKGASSSALLLNAELGQVVDGVIGIDVSFVKNILEKIGPIYVADYKETVTASNLYELTQSFAEKNFFPGSRQKKDFLRSLFAAIKLSFSTMKNISYLGIAKSINDSIDQKHLLFAFGDKNLQDLFTVNGWSSALWEVPDGISSNYINDFIGINEANLGVNKANYFVKRNVIHNVSIDENGNTTGDVNIEYKNTSNKWPGGDYINYLRIILPLSTTISSIWFDGISQDIIPAIKDPLVYEAKNFVAPLGLEVERYDQDGKTIYGFLVNVKAGETKDIKIKYSLSQKIALEAKAYSYSLRIFKQPGVDSYPYSFSLIYPKNLRVIEGSALHSFDLTTDKELKIDFIL